MANQQNVECLLKGRDAWNTWRAEHPEVEIDFKRANLRGADLSGAHLTGATFMGAHLNVADLSRADLGETDFSFAHLGEADLSRTYLSGAILFQAHLSGANLHSANLSGADLSGADLSGADLSRANLNGVHLGGAHLEGADLHSANLSRADLNGAQLSRAIFSEANLSRANLNRADLSRANLSRADLSGTHLTDANLSGANLSGANLSRANLSGANLSRANLSGANLSRATLIGTNLAKATLTQCSIYGISVWNVQLDGAKQDNLVITAEGESTITVDNLEVAQFIYLLLNNAKIRHVINTITTKVVLILGRFAPDRKAVLDALRESLRQQDYLPVLVDFEKPNSRNFTETISTLAHLARFIIADLTAPRSIPQELQAIIPLLRVPVQPLLQTSEEAYSMFEDLEDTYHWVLPTYRYTTLEALLTSFKTNVIEAAEQKAQQLEKR